MLPFCVWGATDAGYCTLDGSFSVTLVGAANAERFSNALTWMNLGFLGLLASAACFVMWNYACREIGVVRTTVGLYRADAMRGADEVRYALQAQRRAG